MDRNRHQKTRRVAFNPRHRLTPEDRHNLINRLREMIRSLRYGASRQRPRFRSVKCQTTIPIAPSNPTEALNMRVNSDRKEVPFFKTYEEFHKTILRSFENISIILNTDGKVVYISQNVSSLLGHRPEEIVGKTLLNILLDEEQEEVSQKIILNPPLDKSVGSLIEFCCYLRKRTAGLFTQDSYTYMDMYDRRDTYEYVKFVLYLQDSYDEIFVIFGNYGRSSRKTWLSTSRLLREQRYFLVGTISVLRTRAESGQPPTIQPPVEVTYSDDDNNTQSQRLQKRRKREEIQEKHQDENLNMESPVSSSDVEIVDIIPAPRQIPFELSQVRTPSRSSTCTTISTATGTRMSSSGDFAATASALATSTSGQDSMIEAKHSLDPVDMEFEVGPEFLLSDSQKGQNSPKYGECSSKDGKKPLEEATGSKPKEYAIDEAPGACPDDYSCVIVEDTEIQKDPKIQELVVDQEQRHQKTVETSAQSPSPVAQPVHPVAQPVHPVAQPVHPVAQPVHPVAQPVHPVAQPVRPVVQPVRPLVQPVRPVVQPVHPVAQPVRPVVQPVHPVAQPVRPVVQPVRPVVQPVRPVAQPVRPLVQPVRPVLQPVHPVAQPVRPEAVLEPMVCTDLPTYAVAEPRALVFQYPLSGERYVQLCDLQMRTQVYDLSTSRTFNEEPPSNREVAEEEREQEQCVYELVQRIELLCDLPYEPPRAQDQMGQGQENRIYQPQEQVVTVINNLGQLPFNFFGNGNFEYPQNETHRLGNDHVNHTYSVFHDPSTRSYQPTYPVFHDPSTRSRQPTYPVPYQPGAATYQPLAAPNQTLTRIHHPPARSQYPSTRSQVSEPQSFESRDSNTHGLGPSENFMQLWNNAMGHTAQHRHLVKDNIPWIHGQENEHAGDIL